MTATDALAAYLSRKQTLLILDNCEHVLSAAAALADRLMSSCPIAAHTRHQPPTLRPSWRDGLAGPIAGGARRA